MFIKRPFVIITKAAAHGDGTPHTAYGDELTVHRRQVLVMAGAATHTSYDDGNEEQGRLLKCYECRQL